MIFSEEKLLHEEVHTNWEEAQRLGVSGELSEELRPNLPPGVREHYDFNKIKNMLNSLNFFRLHESIFKTSQFKLERGRANIHTSKIVIF